MARVVLEQLTKTFSGAKGETVYAVKEVCLTVADQEFVVLVGPSGCGKSTTLRLIAGLEEATSGTITIDERVVNRVEPKDRDVAMVFQNYALYPHLTVYENLAFGLKLRKVPKPEIERRVRAAAAILDLEPLFERLPRALSGGQRQRVAVGRAIVRQPKAFLFDEPLSNLDAQLRGQMRLELAKLHRRLAATMIYVTHDQVEAMTLGDRIVVMKDGCVQQVATPLELYHRPANLFVAGFIGAPAMNLFRGTLEADAQGLWFRAQGDSAAGARATLRARVAPEHTAGLQPHVGLAVVLGVRPEDLAPAGEGTPAEATTFSAPVELVEPMGAETYLHLAAGAAPVVVRVQPDTRATAGDALRLRLDMARAHYFHAADGRRCA